MKVFFGLSPRKPVEIKVLKDINPDNLMLSYYYWKRKNLKKDLIDKIEYIPAVPVYHYGE